MTSSRVRIISTFLWRTASPVSRSPNLRATVYLTRSRSHLAEEKMKKAACTTAFLLALTGALSSAPTARAAPCLVVTLTGTSGPPPFNGLAGPGTLVEYGDDANGCRSVLMQFDAGRGTLMRLSQIGVHAAQLNAVFFTHMHSDHMEGFSDIVQMRWIFGGLKPPKLDVVCSSDAKTQFGFTLSCKKFVAHIDDAYEQSGETAYRKVEGKVSTVRPAPLQG